MVPVASKVAASLHAPVPLPKPLFEGAYIYFTLPDQLPLAFVKVVHEIPDILLIAIAEFSISALEPSLKLSFVVLVLVNIESMLVVFFVLEHTNINAPHYFLLRLMDNTQLGIALEFYLLAITVLRISSAKKQSFLQPVIQYKVLLAFLIQVLIVADEYRRSVFSACDLWQVCIVELTKVGERFV